MKQLITLFFAGLLFSCSEKIPSTPQVDKYGTGWDNARREIGLPRIKDHLVLSSFGFECLDPYTDCATFINPDTSKKPLFAKKNIYWDSAGINLERNYFVGKNGEVLQIYYGYKKFSDWTHIGFGYGFRTSANVIIDSFKKEQADSVLAAWKITF